MGPGFEGYSLIDLIKKVILKQSIEGSESSLEYLRTVARNSRLVEQKMSMLESSKSWALGTEKCFPLFSFQLESSSLLSPGILWGQWATLLQLLPLMGMG